MIEVVGVSHSFAALPVLSGVSLSIDKGEFISVVGPSGCGKTTLLKIIAGLIQPTSGQVHLADRQISGPPGQRSLGLVFQTPVLLPWRSVQSNVSLPLEMNREGAGDTDLVREVLTRVGLADFASSMPAELSGGMQHRVSLARALVSNPPVLLMDEPFASVDELMREKLDSLVLDLTEASRKTIVFVTHSVPEAVWLSDRVIVLGPRPARIEQIVEVRLPRPRCRELFAAEHTACVRDVRLALGR